MAFGPARPPITEDVAEVIVKDVKEAEGHTPTSETPIAFLPRNVDGTTVAIAPRTKAFALGGIALVALLVIVLMMV